MSLRGDLDSLWPLWLCVRKQKIHPGSHEGTKTRRKKPSLPTCSGWDKALYISKTLQVAKRYGSGYEPEPAGSKMSGEALALPLERVIGRKHAYVHAKPNDIAERAANLKIRPT